MLLSPSDVNNSFSHPFHGVLLNGEKSSEVIQLTSVVAVLQLRSHHRQLQSHLARLQSSSGLRYEKEAIFTNPPLAKLQLLRHRRRLAEGKDRHEHRAHRRNHKADDE